MAAPQANPVEPQAQSAMPPPVMEYVNKYTDVAVKNGYAPKPPAPITDSYQMFGQICHQDDVIIRPLETQGIKRLHPEHYKKKEELRKMTVSILCNFLDFLDILVKCGLSPDRDKKIEDLNLLFIHMHHLINEFRPHQARETLKVMMAMQKKNLVDCTERLSKHMEKSSGILKHCSEEIATLMTKHKQLTESRLLQEDLMDIDDVLSSTLLSIPQNQSTSTDALHEQSHNQKDMILCGLLDNINE